MHNNCKYESEKIVNKIYNLIYMLRNLTLSKIPKYLKTFSCFETYVHNFISTLAIQFENYFVPRMMKNVKKSIRPNPI